MADPSRFKHPPTSLLLEVETFNQIATLSKKKLVKALIFVKNIGEVPKVSLPLEGPMKVALSKNHIKLSSEELRPLISNNVTSYFLGRWFFLFDFISKED